MIQRNIKLHVSASTSDEAGAGMLAPTRARTAPPPVALQTPRHSSVAAVKLSSCKTLCYLCMGAINK